MIRNLVLYALLVQRERLHLCTVAAQRQHRQAAAHLPLASGSTSLRSIHMYLIVNINSSDITSINSYSFQLRSSIVKNCHSRTKNSQFDNYVWSYHHSSFSAAKQRVNLCRVRDDLLGNYGEMTSALVCITFAFWICLLPLHGGRSRTPNCIDQTLHLCSIDKCSL